VMVGVFAVAGGLAGCATPPVSVPMVAAPSTATAAVPAVVSIPQAASGLAETALRGLAEAAVPAPLPAPPDAGPGMGEALLATTDTEGSPSQARPEDALQEVERGSASWYGLQFHGRRTANGERFDRFALTAAHKTLPFGTVVRVRSLLNGREVDVRINDRGPFVAGRIIDLSHAAAEALGMLGMGIKQVVLLALDSPASSGLQGPTRKPARKAPVRRAPRR
jgi:rare lipoprotein A